MHKHKNVKGSKEKLESIETIKRKMYGIMLLIVVFDCCAFAVYGLGVINHFDTQAEYFGYAGTMATFHVLLCTKQLGYFYSTVKSKAEIPTQNFRIVKTESGVWKDSFVLNVDSVPISIK